MQIPEMQGLVEFLHANPVLMIAIVAIVLGFFFVQQINARNINVGVGLADNIHPEQRHGTAWLIDWEGSTVRKDIHLDRAYLLDGNPNRYQIKDIFNQIHKLGYQIDHIQILVGDKVRVYRSHQHRPICTAARYA